MNKRMVYQLPMARSVWLTGILIVIHLLALFVCLTIDVSFSMRLLLMLIVTLSAVYYWLGFFSEQGSRQVRTILRFSDNTWQLQRQNKPSITNLKLTGSYVSPQLLILYFSAIDKRNIKRYSTVIMFDAVDSTLFRHLRIHCRDIRTFQQ